MSAIKKLLIGGAVALIVLGIVLYRRMNAVSSRMEVSTEQKSSIQPSAQASNAPTTLAERQLPGGPYVSSDPRWAIARQKDKVDHNWEWRMPINFYGRVVDQADRPVSGANVHAQWSDLSPNGASNEDTLSDAQGSFSITSKIGRGISIRVQKEGYYSARSERLKSFDYAGFWEANYHEPDPARPVIFHLQKKGNAETLTVGEAQPPLARDGTPTGVDLLNGGRASEGGQLKIAAVTNTEKYPPRVFDWRASITVPGGGLIEHNVEFPFEAPEEGYKATVEFDMPAGAPDWRRSVEKTFFIRFGRPPTYGRIHVRFNGASQKMFLTYVVNPSGSRNLETKTDDPFSNP